MYTRLAYLLTYKKQTAVEVVNSVLVLCTTHVKTCYSLIKFIYN